MSPHYAARRRERDRELPRALCARFFPVTLAPERELRRLFPRALVVPPEREREERELVTRRAPERPVRRELPRAEDAERRLLARPSSRFAPRSERREVLRP